MANLKEIFNQIELIKNILTDKNDVNEIPQIEYDIVMEKIYELNPDAKVVVINIQNLADDIVIEFQGEKLYLLKIS